MKLKIIDNSSFENELAIRGYSKRDFAKKAGIGATTCYRMLKQDGLIFPRTARKVANALDTDIKDIFEVVN